MTRDYVPMALLLTFEDAALEERRARLKMDQDLHRKQMGGGSDGRGDNL